MAQPQKQPSPLQTLDFSQPQETRQFPNGKLELILLNGVTFGRVTFQPGWKWSRDVSPIAQTRTCQAAHLGIQLSGVMHIVMEDGTERDIHPGELFNIPPGHDGWVVGDEPVVAIDISGMENYAKQIKAA